jgi:putative oxidoreductase
MESLNNAVLLVGRLLMASLFLSAGFPKLLDLGAGFSVYLDRLGVPYPEYVSILGVAVEVLVPLALILGIFPRLSALLAVAFVVVATGLAHRFWEAPEAQQQLESIMFFKNLAIIGGLLMYYVSGPGAWSFAGRSAGVGAAATAQA